MTSPIDHHAEVLSLSNIKVQYGHRTVLDQIEFSIHAGEFIGLIGANGAGKTTLLHVILGLLKPNEGTIHVNGQLMSHSSKQIGYVPQRIHLDPDTPLRARDLVALGIDGTRFDFRYLVVKNDRLSMKFYMQWVRIALQIHLSVNFH